jgi:hypothetical protein
LLRDIGYSVTNADEFGSDFLPALARVYGTLLTDAYAKAMRVLDGVQEQIGEIRVEVEKEDNQLSYLGDYYTGHKVIGAQKQEDADGH